MNCFITVCISEGAVGGYVAAILCNIVQLERPSSSTSGGQSEGTGEIVGFVEIEELPRESVLELGIEAIEPFIIAFQAEEEVQVRHLITLDSHDHVVRTKSLTVFHLDPEPLRLVTFLLIHPAFRDLYLTQLTCCQKSVTFVQENLKAFVGMLSSTSLATLTSNTTTTLGGIFLVIKAFLQNYYYIRRSCLFENQLIAKVWGNFGDQQGDHQRPESACYAQ